MTDAPSARLFVSLELPAEAVEALSVWGSRAAAAISGLRSVRAESLHLTLCFLGRCPVDAVPEIAALCRTAEGMGAVPLQTETATWLPERRPRVLAVALTDPSGSLGRLRGQVAAALIDGGWYQPEHRSFLPHVSVARVRGGERIPSCPLTPVPPLSFEARTVTLMRSHIGRDGARYEVLSTVSLAD